MESSPKVGATQWLEKIKATQQHGEEQKMECHVHPYIFIVPDSLRIERPEAYLPRVASLGPYHHLKLELYEAERYKSRLIIQVEKRAKRGSFEGLVTEIINRAEEIRNSYNDPIECGDEVLGWMMARDAVFILEFLGCYNQYQSPRYQEANPYLQRVDAVFHPERKSPLFFSFQVGIFKLENQVPLFILKEVLAWETGSEAEASHRLKMTISSACKKFTPFIPVQDSYHSLTRAQYNISLGERHLLECLYNSVIPKEDSVNVNVSIEENHMRRFRSFHFLHQTTSKFRDFLTGSPKSYVRDNKNLPSATELHNRGVKFAPLTWASEKIRFDRASSTLFLPCIEMDYRTDVFLRNMVAVEAFMMWKTRVFTCYADLMDKLIDTPSDVAVLKRYGIITSELGCNKEISNLWNGIRRSIWRSTYEPIDQTIKDVNTYYRSRYGVLLGEFLHEHFSNPWRAASVVGACALLVLAFLQTLFSFYQLPHHHHQNHTT